MWLTDGVYAYFYYIFPNAFIFTYALTVFSCGISFGWYAILINYFFKFFKKISMFWKIVLTIVSYPFFMIVTISPLVMFKYDSMNFDFCIDDLDNCPYFHLLNTKLDNLFFYSYLILVVVLLLLSIYFIFKVRKKLGKHEF